jgi:hypothetical protein
MSASYAENNGNPVHRLRRHVPDTAVSPEASAQFSDERYWSWLDSSRSSENLRIWMPSDNEAGNTTGTVEVLLDPATQELRLQLTADVTGAEAAITLSPTGNPTKVHEVIRTILALDNGWEIGLDGGGLVEWFEASAVDGGGDWTAGIADPANESLAMLCRASVFAMTGINGSSGPVSCFGEYEQDAFKLRCYRFTQVLVCALEDLSARKTSRSVTSREEGNVTRTWSSTLSEVRPMLSSGIYGRIG